MVAALILLLIPGPGVLYVLTRSLTQGRDAGVVSAAGLSVGALVHVAAATAGLSAVLLTSAAAFGVVKALGAGYLIYLGLRTLLAAPAKGGTESPTPRSNRRLFQDGVFVSVLNPKIAVFFLAFLPQFVDPMGASIPLQVLILGTMYSVMAFATDSAYALLAARLRHRLSDEVVHGPALRRTSGTVYIGLGLTTAFADQS